MVQVKDLCEPLARWYISIIKITEEICSDSSVGAICDVICNINKDSYGHLAKQYTWTSRIYVASSALAGRILL